jgi:hypothetical protein
MPLDHETYMNVQASVMLLSTSTPPTDQNGFTEFFTILAPTCLEKVMVGI